MVFSLQKLQVHNKCARIIFRPYYIAGILLEYMHWNLEGPVLVDLSDPTTILTIDAATL